MAARGVSVRSVMVLVIVSLLVVYGVLLYRPAPPSTPAAETVVRPDPEGATRVPDLPPAVPHPGHVVGIVPRQPESPTPVPVVPKALGPAQARAARVDLESAGMEDSQSSPLDYVGDAAEFQAMDSAELVEALVDSPLQVSVVHLSDRAPQRQLASLASTHPGVDILYSRADAAASLLDAYQAYSSAIAEVPADGVLPDGVGLVFTTIETLLGADSILDQFYAAGQLPTVIGSVLVTLERQANYDASQPEPVFGESMIDQSATLVGLCLESLQGPVFIEWLAVPERSGILTERPPTYAESQEILEMAAAAYPGRNVGGIAGAEAKP